MPFRAKLHRISPLQSASSTLSSSTEAKLAAATHTPQTQNPQGKQKATPPPQHKYAKPASKIHTHTTYKLTSKLGMSLPRFPSRGTQPAPPTLKPHHNPHKTKPTLSNHPHTNPLTPTPSRIQPLKPIRCPLRPRPSQIPPPTPTHNQPLEPTRSPRQPRPRQIPQTTCKKTTCTPLAPQTLADRPPTTIQSPRGHHTPTKPELASKLHTQHQLSVSYMHRPFPHSPSQHLPRNTPHIHSREHLQILLQHTHFLIPLISPHSCINMAPTPEETMTHSHKAPATDTPRLEIPLRNKTRTTRSTGTETKSGPRTALNTEKQQAAEKGPSRAGGGDSAGRRARLGDPNGTSELPNGSRSGSRRRAFIADSSEDEDGVNAAQYPHHPSLMKGKTSPSHDSDIDMLLAGMSPEHGGSSLHLSMTNDDFVAAPNQAAHRLDITNLAEKTPITTSHKSPMNTTISDNQSAKRRRGEAEGLSSIPDSHRSHTTRYKEAIPSIAIVSHMWLGFAIHEAIASHKHKAIIHEHHTDEEFLNIGTPPPGRSLNSRRFGVHSQECPNYSTPTNGRMRYPATTSTSHNSLGMSGWTPQPDFPRVFT